MTSMQLMIQRALLILCLFTTTLLTAASIPRRPCCPYIKVLGAMALLQTAREWNKHQEMVTLTEEDVRKAIRDEHFLNKTRFIKRVTREPLAAISIIMALEKSITDYLNDQTLPWAAVMFWKNETHKRSILTDLCKGRPLALTELQAQLDAIYHPRARI